ncbi:MAG TPA: SBBP repeat-containing protein [Terriglobia bacterium]|nr:SBBP repeat-containing protein [Terriglobia bacterium]
MRFAGANPASEPYGAEGLPGRSNYFLGNDRSQWHTNIPQFARVRYPNLYRGVDLDFYGKQGRLEYDFEVNPGADPKQIALDFSGAKSLELAADGDLVIATADGELRFQAPHIYQASSHGNDRVSGNFVLRGGLVAFELGAYDHGRTLVIDPVLSFSTFLGGSGSESCAAIAGATFVPHCPGITLDFAGNVYIAGATTNTSAGWPVTPDSANAGTAPDVFVARISGVNSAPTLDYVTFIGGEGTDYPTGVAVDSGSNVYVAGTTNSQKYPTTNGFQLSPATATVQNHAFLTKLDSTGSLNLYSTYISGNGIDTASDLAVDTQGRAYVFGTTTSSSGFPTTPGALQTSPRAANQFFLTKVDAAVAGPNSLLYSTYIGGSTPANGIAVGGAVAVDSAFNVYIAGGTSFTDMPVVNACQGASQGGTDVWVARLNQPITTTQQYTPSYETYLGAPGDTSQVDVAYGIATDNTNTYVTGSTNSTKFSNALCGGSSGTLTAFQAAYGGGASDAFIAQIGVPSTSGTTQGTVPLNYFSYLGGGGTDVGLAIATDANHDARVAGMTTSGTGFPGTPTTFGSPLGAEDAFFARIVVGSSTTATSSATSVLGGSANDFATSTAVDPVLNSYIAGETASSNFPVSANALQSFPGAPAAFVTELAPDTSKVSFACNPAFGTINGAGCATPAPANPTFSPSPVGVGGSVTFNYSIYNQGDPVSGAVFTDTLTPNSTLTSISGLGSNSCSGTGCCTTTATATTCTLTLGTLATSNTATTTVNGTSTTTIAPVGQVQVVVTATPPSATGFPPQPPGNVSNSAKLTIPGPGCQAGCQATGSAQVNDFAIQATPSLQKVTAGAEASYSVTVQPSSNSGFPESISLACGPGLPTGATCSFPNNPVPNLNSGPVTRVLDITTTARVTTPARLFHGGGPVYAFWLPIGGLALVGGLSRRRRLLLAALLAMVIATIAFFPGCSNSSNTSLTTGTPAGTYTVTVNATSGNATRSTAVQLEVQ